MTSVTGIPVSSAQQLHPTSSVRIDPAEMARIREDANRLAAGMSKAERTVQIAKQDAVKAHTVFQVGGAIVAVQQENGWTLFPSSGDGATASGIKSEAARLGVTGDAFNDFLADQIEKDLRQTYGASLQVQRFEPGQGPTMGQLKSAIVSNPSTTPLADAPPPTTSLDSETLLLLSKIREAQEARTAGLNTMFPDES